MPSFDGFHIHGYKFFAFIADVGARLCCIPLMECDSGSGKQCSGGEAQQLADDLDRPGNAARTLGAHQIPGIRR
jgi:hypothetical protein